MTTGPNLLRAARDGDMCKVRELISCQVDVNTSNGNGLTPLHLAAKEGHLDIVNELFPWGANVNAKTKPNDGAQTFNRDMCMLMPNTVCTWILVKKGNTPLHMAALAGREETVEVLVQHGANVNTQAECGFTPLYCAAQANHLRVATFLLTNDASPSLTADGFPPIKVAQQQGHEQMVSLLQHHNQYIGHNKYA